LGSAHITTTHPSKRKDIELSNTIESLGIGGDAVARAAIVGGTHGNELTGIHLIRRWQSNPQEVARPSFSTELLVGNPKATSLNRRFVDQDLNRSFGLGSLADTQSAHYEVARAAQINALLGPKGAPHVDFIIDLHTSTSNVGAMIIVAIGDVYNRRLAAYLQSRVPGSRIFCAPPASSDHELTYLTSICSRSLAVEVGPVPQGSLDYRVFSLTADLTAHALDYVHLVNTGAVPDLPASIEVFQACGTIQFPMLDGHINGIIHESVLGRDYEPLLPKAPIFRTLAGEVICYEGDEVVYPVFINEAAYYYQGQAMTLTIKKTYPL
jgi:aspartoacylase